MTFVRLIRKLRQPKAKPVPPPSIIPPLQVSLLSMQNPQPQHHPTYASIFGQVVHHVFTYISHQGDPLELTAIELNTILFDQFPHFSDTISRLNMREMEYILKAWHEIALYIYERSKYFATEVDFLGTSQVDILMQNAHDVIEMTEVKTFSRNKNKSCARKNALKQIKNSYDFIRENYPDTKLIWTTILIGSDTKKPFKIIKQHYANPKNLPH